MNPTQSPGLAEAVAAWRRIVHSWHAGLRREPVAQALGVIVTGLPNTGKSTVRQLVTQALSDFGGCASIDVAELQQRYREFTTTHETGRGGARPSDDTIAQAGAAWLRRAMDHRTPLVLELDGSRCDQIPALVDELRQHAYRVPVLVLPGDSAPSRRGMAPGDAEHGCSLFPEMLEELEREALAAEVRFVDRFGATRKLIALFPGNRVQRARRAWADLVAARPGWQERSAEVDPLATHGGSPGSSRQNPAAISNSCAADRETERRAVWQQLLRQAAADQAR